MVFLRACVVVWVDVSGGKREEDGCYRWEIGGILDALYRWGGRSLHRGGRFMRVGLSAGAS